MKQTIEAGGRLLYLDTDSIFAAFDKKNKNAIKNLPINPKNSKEITDAVFASNKLYTIKYSNGEEDIKISGIIDKNISFNDFKNNFFSNNTENSIQLTTTEISSKTQFNNFKSVISIKLNSYKKRQFSKNKIYTKPYYHSYLKTLENDPNL